MATADDSVAKTSETPRTSGGTAAAAAGLPHAATIRVAPDHRLKQLRWAVVAASSALVVFAAIRVSFVDGLFRRVTIDGPSMAPALCGPHYKIACADCGFAFRCDAEYVPADRRVVCPNCGFTDNSLDSTEPSPADRVVIDRWPLQWRNPTRGEIVALKRLAGELAVKRIAALPGDHFAIRGGDLFDGDRLLRKPRHERLAVRQLVHDNSFQPQKTSDLPPRWRPAAGDSRWKSEGTSFRLESSDSNSLDWLRYEHWPCTANAKLRGVASPIADNDAYNQGELKRALNPVTEVTFSCRLRAKGKGRLAFAASDGDQRFEVEIDPGKRLILRSEGQVLLERPLLINASRHDVEVEVGLCDQQVLLAFEGRTALRFAYDRRASSRSPAVHPLAIGAAGLEIRLNDLRVWRDIYYLGPQGLPVNWQAPTSLAKDEFAVLGDNQPVSIDSRQWEPFAASRRAILGRVYRPLASGN
jgi:hypothetical protein